MSLLHTLRVKSEAALSGPDSRGSSPVAEAVQHNSLLDDQCNELCGACSGTCVLRVLFCLKEILTVKRLAQ